MSDHKLPQDFTDKNDPRYGMVGADEIRSDNPAIELKDVPPFTRTLLDTGVEEDTPAYLEAMDSLHNFRISKDNPIHGLHAIWVFLRAGLVLPADLKRWLADNILLTLNSDGDVSMDKAFGLTDAAGHHNAFTTHNRRAALSKELFIIHWLVTDFGFSASLAARLNYERHVSLGFTDVARPGTTRVRYSELSEKPEISITHFTWQDAKDYSLAMLRTFDVPSLSPQDRNNLRQTIQDITATNEADWPVEYDDLGEPDDDWLV